LDLTLFLARNNQNDEAMMVYQNALTRGLDTPGMHWAMGLAQLGKGLVADARREFVRVQQAGGYQSLGRLYVARTYIYEGAFAAAIQQLNANAATDRASGNTYPELVDRYLLASVYVIQNKRQMARHELGLILGSAGTHEFAQAGDLVRIGVMYARMQDLSS